MSCQVSVKDRFRIVNVSENIVIDNFYLFVFLIEKSYQAINGVSRTIGLFAGLRRK